MARAVGETTLQTFALDMVLLAEGSRTPTVATITAGDGAGAGGVAGDETLELDVDTDNSPLDLKAGTSLSFLDTGNNRRVQALLRDDITLTNGAPVVANVFPLRNDIPDTSTSEYVVGLLALEGVQDFSFATSDQEVDTTDTKSGPNMESALIRSDKTIDVSIIVRPNDQAFYELVTDVALAGGFYGREVYAVATYPHGGQFKGAAKIKNLQMPANQNEVEKASFQLQFQGDSFRYVPPFTYPGA